jgi:hypothetical protein
MALYSPDTYEPFHKKYTHEQRVNGGRKRASMAKRDHWGRLLPNNDAVLPEPINHGKAGGLKRSEFAKRIKGKFAPKD